MNIEKPKISEKCNGCGICCAIQVCGNGSYVLGLVENYGETVPGPCPALTKKKDGSFACGVVERPNKYLKHRPYPAKVLSKHFGVLIGAGNGCDDLGYYPDSDDSEKKKLDDHIEKLKKDEDFRKKIKTATKVIYGIET